MRTKTPRSIMQCIKHGCEWPRNFSFHPLDTNVFLAQLIKIANFLSHSVLQQQQHDALENCKMHPAVHQSYGPRTSRPTCYI